MSYWNDQVVLVTGGLGGIGKELVTRFYSLGCKVAVNYNTQIPERNSFDFQINEDRLFFIQADVSNSTSVNEMINKIEEKWGVVTMLINNAGSVSDKLIMMMTDDDWFKMINSHLTGAFFCSRRVVKGMMQNRFGKILMISSISATKGAPGQVHYSAAKGGMLAMSKSLSRELGSKGITCNCLILGLIETEKVKSSMLNKYYQEKVEASSLRKIGTLKDVADAAEFVLSNKCNHMNGQSLVIDGGIT